MLPIAWPALRPVGAALQVTAASGAVSLMQMQENAKRQYQVRVRK